MTTYKPGDIILVRFPFTDLSTAKKRPALIISAADYNDAHNDVIIIALTSRKQDDSGLELSEWKEAGLIKRTWLKPVFATINAQVIQRTLGKIAEIDREWVKNAIENSIDITFFD
jgi:mRNA interferase MazF